METQGWQLGYRTGLPDVDAQHAELELLLNGVGQAAEAQARPETLWAACERVERCARSHFATESRLMREAGVDARHRARHEAQHALFLEELRVVKLPARRLFQLMTGWFGFHIPTEDEAMARQVFLIRSGWGAGPAWEAVCQAATSAPRVPVDRVEELLEVLFDQHRDLLDTGAGLERRVQQANQALAAGQEELRALLRRVDDARAQLVQSEKLAVLGQLAAGVAHEINNPVAYVGSNLAVLGRYLARLLTLVDAYEAHDASQGAAREAVERVRREVELDVIRDDAAHLLAESAEGLERVHRTVRQLQEFARADDEDLAPTDLDQTVETTLGVAWNLLKHRCEVTRHLGQPPPVRCLPGQVRQVVLNLVLNAAQALDAGCGAITVSTGAQGGWAWVEVQDTGVGMTPEVQRHIFEPFFTTRPVGQGTGLGLSLAWDVVVKRHGGHLDVTSAPGRGSTFRLWLPVDGPLPRDAQPPREATPTPRPLPGAVRVDQPDARLS